MPDKPKYPECTLWFCHSPHYSRGLCARHYQNHLRCSDPLGERSEDMRVALLVIDQFRSVLMDLLENDNGYLITRDRGVIASAQCKFCGSTAPEMETVAHTENCPIQRAVSLMEHTHSEPPKGEGDLSYEL